MFKKIAFFKQFLTVTLSERTFQALVPDPRSPCPGRAIAAAAAEPPLGRLGGSCGILRGRLAGSSVLITM